MEKLLLSADDKISLYEVDKNILDNLNELVHEFDKVNKKTIYDERDFVKFLKEKFNNNSINYIKVVGQVKGKYDSNIKDYVDDIEDEYKDVKHFNF